MRWSIDRRGFVKAGLGWALAGPALLSGALAGCGGGEEAASPPSGAKPPEPTKPAPAPTQPTPEPAAEAPPPAEPAGGGASGPKLVTDIPANKPLVDSLQYTHTSAKPDQNCANCQFYTAQSGGLGSCQLFTQGGLVKSGGWCASWVKKVGAA